MVERVFGVHDVKRRVFEWKLLSVRDAEAEPGLVAPSLERLNVDRDDVAHTLPDQSCDTAVSAAAIEHRLDSAEREPELVEAAQAIATLACRQAAWVLTA